jgi:hypothetical protein
MTQDDAWFDMCQTDPLQRFDKRHDQLNRAQAILAEDSGDIVINAHLRSVIEVLDLLKKQREIRDRIKGLSLDK